MNAFFAFFFAVSASASGMIPCSSFMSKDGAADLRGKKVPLKSLKRYLGSKPPPVHWGP